MIRSLRPSFGRVLLGRLALPARPSGFPAAAESIAALERLEQVQGRYKAEQETHEERTSDEGVERGIERTAGNEEQELRQQHQRDKDEEQ